ncbi:MAG: hypothetical protein HQ582_25875, partial [Planctomycetes bacterium]|nr:hypothetical protein [Planctomycetota bacterium]
DGSPASGVTLRPVSIFNDVGYLGIGIDAAKEKLPGCWPQSVRTNAEGTFTISGLPKDSVVTFYLRDPSYGQERLTVDTKLEATESPEEADQASGESRSDPLPSRFTHRLTPPRPVEGLVTAADTGEPFAGMFVEMRANGSRGGWPIYGRTDQRGRYRINASEARSYDVHVYPAQDSGYLAGTRRHQGWPEGAQSLQLDFILHRGKLIRGQVLDDQTGEPISGASVVYKPSRKNPNRRSNYYLTNAALTDDEGR